MHPEDSRTTGKGSYPEIGSIEVRKKIGEEIRSAREFQQLSVEQVSEMTKINKRYLEAIENGEWSFLPPTYVRAFIITAAITAGLEAAEMEKRLRDIFPVDSSEQGIVRSAEMSNEDVVQQTRGTMSWTEQNRSLIFYGLIGIVAIVLVIVYLTNPSRSPDRIAENLLQKESEPVEIVKEEPAVDTTTVVAETTQVITPIEIEPSVETYELEVYAADTCYVKIEDADTVTFAQNGTYRIMEV